MNRVFGYVTSRSFNGLTIPVPAQNSCLREYAYSQNKIYVLPPLEHNFKDCYMQLYSVLNQLEDSDTIVMYSVGMMPNSSKRCKEIIELIKKKNSYIYFVLEAKLIQSWVEIKNLLFTYALRKILDDMNQPSIEELRNLI